MTFYKINYIAPTLSGNSTIGSGSKEFECTLPYEEIWKKLRDLQPAKNNNLQKY